LAGDDPLCGATGTGVIRRTDEAMPKTHRLLLAGAALHRERNPHSNSVAPALGWSRVTERIACRLLNRAFARRWFLVHVVASLDTWSSLEHDGFRRV
jgi:hypothetical protein